MAFLIMAVRFPRRQGGPHREKGGTNKERLYAYIAGKEKLFPAALQKVYGLMVEEDADR